MVAPVVVPDPAALAVLAADFIAGRIQARPDLSILVATGQTPMDTYAELARRVAAGVLDASGVTAVQLDEYLDLGPNDPRRLWTWMEASFVRPLGVTRTVRFDPAAPTPEAACRAFSQELAALGPIDLAVLGLGPNGHLGFNEPPSAPDAPTRAVTLTPESLTSNAAYWPGQTVPGRALTAGMDVILGVREALLLVSGERKRAILRATLSGAPSPDRPASLLDPGRLTVIADAAAWGDGVT